MAWSIPTGMSNFKERAVTDGRYIYGWTAAGAAIQRYDPVADSDIAISDTSLVPGGSTGYLQWFKGQLYIAVTDNAAVSPVWEIHRWSGATSWTKVSEITEAVLDADSLSPIAIEDDPVPCTFLQFCSDGNIMVLAILISDTSCAAFDGSKRVYLRYTTDGSNWSTGRSDNETFPELAQVHSTGAAGLLYDYHDFPRGKIRLCIGIGGTPAAYADRTNTVFSVSNTGFFTEIDNHASRIYEYADARYLWRRHWGPTTYTDAAYSATPPSWATATDTGIMPIPSNTKWPVGWKIVAGDMYVYFWSAGDWVNAELVLATVGASTIIRNFIRVSSGECFLWLRDPAGTIAWFERGDLLGCPTCPADEDPYATGKFYYGQGELKRRSDSPISGTSPGGVALMGKKFFAGSSIDNSPMVAYADKPDYAAWTDYSGSLSVTAPIKSFSATPWGDSEDLEGSEDDEGGGGFQGGAGGQCS